MQGVCLLEKSDSFQQSARCRDGDSSLNSIIIRKEKEGVEFLIRNNYL